MKLINQKLARLLPQKLIYCDIGARWGLGEPWNSYSSNIKLVSFEPDSEEYNVLLKNKKNEDQVFPFALYSDKKQVSLHLTKSRGCSSLLKPNQIFLKNFGDLERFNIEKSISLEATSLNNLLESKELLDLDFIKIDVQGAELEILKGGDRLLNENALGVEVEVEFQSLYENQPLFADVDTFIRNNLSLQIYDLRKAYWKYPEGINVGSSKGQLIFGDALYLRPPQSILKWCEAFDKEKARRKIHMACLVGVVYGYLDYSLCILDLPDLEKYLSKQEINDWKNLINLYGKSLRFNGKGSGRIFSFASLIAKVCTPIHKGWGTGENHLGSRKKFGIFT